MKKVLSLVLAFALVLGTFSMAFAATPSDVVGTDYEDAVERLMALGVVDGFTDGTIRPEDSITREQFAKLMVITLGMGDLVDYAKEDSLFVDVPATNWANGYINIASAKGLIKGYGDGTFGLGDEITYAQALTILVRALGYDDEGLSGKWPYNYIVKANELDITDDVAIVDGDAIRGNVFVLLNNTLDCNLVEKDEDGNYQNKKDEPKLLSKLGTDKVTGVVSSFDEDDMEIVVDGDKLTVEEGFDFEATFGLEITAWCDGDDVLTYTINDDVIYDAAAKDDDDVELINTDDTFEINKDAVVYIDGEKQTKVGTDKVDYDVDYAKVVLNDDDEIIFFDGHTLKPFVVENTNESKEIVYSYGDEVKFEDYTIIDKEGNTISFEDIEDGDIVFYNKGDEYAVVYNDSTSGELGKVYDDSFKMDGDEYAFGAYTKFVNKDDELDSITEDDLETMQDEGDVEIFFNPAGDVVFVAGDLGEEDTSSFYAMVTKDSEFFTPRDGKTWPVDIIKEDGNEADYDILEADFTDIVENISGGGDIDNKDIVKVTVDEDAELDTLEFSKIDKPSANFKTDKKYVDGIKLVSNAVVFDIEEYKTSDDVDDIEVSTWGEVKDDFDEVKDADIIAVDGDAVVIVIRETSRDANETDEYTGMITDLDYNAGDDEWDVEIDINGESKAFTTDADEFSDLEKLIDNDKVAEDALVTIHVDQETELIVDWDEATAGTTFEISKISTSKKTVEDTTTPDAKVYEFANDAVIYDKDMDEIDISDLEVGDNLIPYFAGETDDKSDRYLQYAVKTNSAPPTPEDGEGTITYIDGTKAVTEVTLVHGEELDVDVKFTNDSDANVSINKDDATYTIVNNADGTVEVASAKIGPSENIVILKGKTIKLGSIKEAGLGIGEYTVIVTITSGATTFDSELPVTVVESKDATLKALNVDATLVTGFDADTETYTVVLAEGTTTEPTVTATATCANADDVTITQATDVEGTEAERTATVVVTAEDKKATKTYTVVYVINHKPAVANVISDITANVVDGNITVDLAGVFEDADDDNLTYTVVSGTPATATAIVNDGEVIIVPVGTGTTIITVTANDGIDTFDTTFNVTLN
ncbi:S-layer homology domain-containing protein [Abyssisolibacter fermentans]|uniref:S-layer homology domain-containing protein n=1 Tax=Abyssisolibacter fermentans TaxID=1766203 RepID=UPI00082C34DF|nr:S-layer homology domain-containing protein [Abyssisolibacter fermentans]